MEVFQPRQESGSDQGKVKVSLRDPGPQQKLGSGTEQKPLLAREASRLLRTFEISAGNFSQSIPSISTFELFMGGRDIGSPSSPSGMSTAEMTTRCLAMAGAEEFLALLSII